MKGAMAMKDVMLGVALVVMMGAEAGVLGVARRVSEVDDYAMAVCTEGNRLYAAAGKSLFAFDITKPLEPSFLGEVSGFDNRRQIVAKNGFVYVVSRETGMRIVDARDPKNMRIRSRFDSVEFATGIDVVGNVAFLSERINGVECVDVSDPDHPAHICIRKTGESQSCRYRDGWLYSGEWGGGTVTVFDAHDMKNFHEVGSLNLHGFGDGVEIDGDYLYCSTGHDAKHGPLKGEEAEGRGRGMDIFSIKDPAKPTWVSRVDFPRFKPRNEDFWTPRVSCGLAFCCDSHNGLFVVDVKDPAKPVVVDRFCVPQKGRDWPSGAISSLAIGEGCVYVTSFPGGLHVIPVEGLRPAARPQGTPPVNADYREPYPTDDAKFHVWKPARPGQARTVCVTNDLVYAACGDAGLHVLRIKPEGGFERIGGLPEGRYAYDCAFVDDKFVVAEGLAGFAVYELEGTTGFREVARRGQIGDASSVAYWVWPAGGRKLILTGRCDGYRFFDLDNLSAAEPVFRTHGTCQWDKYVCDRAIDGVLPLLVPYQGMRWLDVGGAKPKMIEFQRGGHDDVGSQCNGVCAFGADKFLYTVGAGYTLAGTDRKFGPVRPLPTVPGITKGEGYFGGIPRSDGRWVVLTGRSTRRIAVFDFADPDRPVLSRSYRVSGNPDLAAFHKGRVVVPCGHQGVLLEK